VRYITFSILAIILAAPTLLTPSSNAGSGENSVPAIKRETTKLADAREAYINYYKDSLNLNRSISILENITHNDPSNLQALLLLSRVYLTYGHTEMPNHEEKIGLFKNGIETGKKAVELAPDNPDAHFVYVANMASLGKEKGIVKSFFMIRKIRNQIELILKLNPKHVEGTAMHGVLFYSLPTFLGGDLYISEVYLRRALALDLHLTTIKIYLAKNLTKQEKYDEAKKVLKEIIHEKRPTVYSDWYFNRETAKKMMEKIEKKQRNSTPSYTSVMLGE
jgi:tetratricopeptide (TPR) repeat protein